MQNLIAAVDPGFLPERYPILRYAFELVNDPAQNKALAYAKDFIEVLNGGSGPYVETLSVIFMLCVGIEMFRSLAKLPKEKVLDVALPFFGATIAAWVALCNYELLVTGLLSVGQFFYDIAGIHTSHIEQYDNVQLTLADQFLSWASWFVNSVFTGAFLIELISTFVMLIGLFRVSMEYVIGLYIGTMALVPALALYPIREVRPATHSLLRYLFTVSLYPFWWIILLAAQNWVFHGFQLAVGSAGGPIITALGRLSIGFLLYKIPNISDRVVSNSFNLSGVSGASVGEAAGIATTASVGAVLGAISGAVGSAGVAVKNLVGGLTKIASGLSPSGGADGGSTSGGVTGATGDSSGAGPAGIDPSGGGDGETPLNRLPSNGTPPPILGPTRAANLLQGVGQTGVGAFQVLAGPVQGALVGSARPFARFFGADLNKLPTAASIGVVFEGSEGGDQSDSASSGTGPDGGSGGGSQNSDRQPQNSSPRRPDGGGRPPKSAPNRSRNRSDQSPPPRQTGRGNADNGGTSVNQSPSTSPVSNSEPTANGPEQPGSQFSGTDADDLARVFEEARANRGKKTGDTPSSGFNATPDSRSGSGAAPTQSAESGPTDLPSPTTNVTAGPSQPLEPQTSSTEVSGVTARNAGAPRERNAPNLSLTGNPVAPSRPQLPVSPSTGQFNSGTVAAGSRSAVSSAASVPPAVTTSEAENNGIPITPITSTNNDGGQPVNATAPPLTSIGSSPETQTFASQSINSQASSSSNPGGLPSQNSLPPQPSSVLPRPLVVKSPVDAYLNRMKNRRQDSGSAPVPPPLGNQ